MIDEYGATELDEFIDHGNAAGLEVRRQLFEELT